MVSLESAAGNDSFYGLLTTILPLFRLFRLPFKLLVFTSLALSALAGIGWDRIVTGENRRRVVAITTVLLVLDRSSAGRCRDTAAASR